MNLNFNIIFFLLFFVCHTKKSNKRKVTTKTNRKSSLFAQGIPAFRETCGSRFSWTPAARVRTGIEEWEILQGNHLPGCTNSRKILSYGIFFSMLTFLFSCSPPEHPGFTKVSSEIFYKILVIGDGKSKPEKNDYLKFSLKMKTLAEKIIFETDDSTLVLTNSDKIQQCLSFLAEGDSATFFVNDTILLDAKIHRVQTPAQYAKEQEYLSWKNDGEMNELKKLNEYLRKKNIDNRYLTDGIYFIPVKRGKGNIVEIGNTVVVHYKGSFPDSSVFDSTYEGKEAFEFKFGDDDQVIRGLELAICQMKKGEKAKIIIPSQLAFGEAGSSTGIVPPFTTVVYEVELVNLK